MFPVSGAARPFSNPVLLGSHFYSALCYRDDLACRLPDLDQEQSDDNLDSESSVSSDSLLEDRGFSLDSEGQ